MATDVPEIERTTIRRATLLLVPFLMLAYLVSFVDRVNLGFSALAMNHDVGLTPAMFGFGGGLFFISYFLFEVPSNLAMRRFGARVWIARIMISWGVVSACTAFVVGPRSFYAVRFVLGAAEAGFFPGVILYLTYWFPAAYRSRIVSLFYVAVPLSSFVGSPISAALLGMDGTLGLHGWQWVFVAEGAPAVLLGIVTLWVLPDGPHAAGWLSTAQRAWLGRRLADDAARSASVDDAVSTWRVLLHPRVLLLALVYAGSSAASNGLSLWQPQILHSFGLSTRSTGWLNAGPFALAAIGMLAWGFYADRRRERVWSTAIPLALSSLGLGLCLVTTSLAPTLAWLSVALIGTYAFKGPFWALSTETLGPRAAAAGLAQINAIGNLAGFGGTWLIGVIRGATGSYPLALLPLLVLEVAGCLIVLGMHARRAPALPESGRVGVK